MSKQEKYGKDMSLDRFFICWTEFCKKKYLRLAVAFEKFADVLKLFESDS